MCAGLECWRREGFMSCVRSSVHSVKSLMYTKELVLNS